LNWDLDSDILHWHTLKRKQPNGGLIICNASLQLQQAPLKIEINLMSVPVYKALKNEEKEIPDHVFFFLFVAGYKTFVTVKSLQSDMRSTLKRFDVERIKSFLKIVILSDKAKVEVDRRRSTDSDDYILVEGDFFWLRIFSKIINEKNLGCKKKDSLNGLSIFKDPRFACVSNEIPDIPDEFAYFLLAQSYSSTKCLQLMTDQEIKNLKSIGEDEMRSFWRTTKLPERTHEVLAAQWDKMKKTIRLWSWRYEIA